MKPRVLDWPEVEDDAILQLVDNQGVTDKFAAADEARDAVAESASGSGCGSYEGWITPLEREVIEDANLSMGARLTYGILRGYQGRNCPEPYPAKATIARKLGCRRETVPGYLEELEEAGLIQIIRGNRRDKRGRFPSHSYRVLGASSEIYRSRHHVRLARHGENAHKGNPYRKG